MTQAFRHLEACSSWDGIQLGLTHKVPAACSTAAPCPLCYWPPCLAFFSKTWKEWGYFHTSLPRRGAGDHLHINRRCLKKTEKTILSSDDPWMAQNRPWNVTTGWWKPRWDRAQERCILFLSSWTMLPLWATQLFHVWSMMVTRICKIPSAHP